MWPWTRPIDLHLKASEAMGAQMTQEGNAMHLEAETGRMRGASIYMDTVSVGATINTYVSCSEHLVGQLLKKCSPWAWNYWCCYFWIIWVPIFVVLVQDIITIEGVDSFTDSTSGYSRSNRSRGLTFPLAAAVGQGVQINNVLYEHLKVLSLS